VRRQARLLACRPDDRRKRPVALRGLAAPLQDDGVTALGGQAGHLHKGVGPAFEDHGDEADGAGNAAQGKALIEEAGLQNLPARIGQLPQGADPRERVVELRALEGEALDQGPREAGRPRGIDVSAVRPLDFGASGLKPRRYEVQGGVFRLAPDAEELGRRAGSTLNPISCFHGH